MLARDQEGRVMASICSAKPYISDLTVAWMWWSSVQIWVTKISLWREMCWKLFLLCEEMSAVGADMDRFERYESLPR